MKISFFLRHRAAIERFARSDHSWNADLQFNEDFYGDGRKNLGQKSRVRSTIGDKCTHRRPPLSVPLTFRARYGG
jgi:hypothetical protein